MQIEQEVCRVPKGQALPTVPEPTGDDRPSRGHTVRMVVTPLALLAAGIVFLAGPRWTVAGIVLCVAAVLVALAEAAIGWAVVHVALRDHANMFKTMAPLLGAEVSAGAREVSGDTADEERERAIDRAVGFGLTRAAARGGFAAGSMDQAARERLRTNVLEERARTYAWLQECADPVAVERQAEDGVRLVARALVADPGSPRWVLLCHGYAGTWDSMLQYARSFAEAGYNLLMPDMRAHGSSGGRYIGMGFLDRRDVVGWSRWLTQGDGAVSVGACAATGVVLFGHSMGASSVCMAAGEPDIPAEVKAVVADCGFDSTWHAISSVAQKAGVPVHPTVDLARMNLMVRRGGYDIARGDVVGALSRASLPVMIVHGLDDEMVPPYMATLLHRATHTSEVLLVSDAGHCQSSLVDPNGYWERVLGFADRCLA